MGREQKKDKKWNKLFLTLVDLRENVTQFLGTTRRGATTSCLTTCPRK